VEYKILWAGDGQSVTITTSGRVTVEAMDSWVQTVLDDSRYRPDLRILLDDRASESAHLTVGDVRRRVDLLERDSERFGQPRIACVVNTKVDFGVSRMTQSLSEGRWHGVTRVFEDIDDARAWLWETD